MAGLSLYYVNLRNDYGKPLAVYKLRGVDEFTGEDVVNSPEGIFLTKWKFEPAALIKTGFVATTGGRVRLTAEAVIFEDGSGDEDAAVVATLERQRVGTGLAYKQLIPLLR